MHRNGSTANVAVKSNGINQFSRRDWLRSVAAGAGLVLAGRFGWGQEETTGSGLIVHTESPRNAEPPVARLLDHWLTPVENFYIRSNADVPAIDLDAFRVSVEGLVERPQVFSLAELVDRFPPAEVTATLCCAGNRRNEFNAVRPVDGLPWGPAALGNARWGGVRLRDVLQHAGLRPDARHVWFDGLDKHSKRGREIVFGASIPLERVLADDPTGDVLLAGSMNGAALTPDHGAPLRSLVPGYVGARSVKWLSRIVVSDRPTDNYYVTEAYRLVQEETPEAWQAAAILYELPLQSVICTTSVDRDARRPRVTARGYALPAGHAGCTVQRVEVSADGGRTWTTAELDGESRPYCWQFWRAELRLGRRGAGRILVRAIGSDWQLQPERPEWNAKGYFYNGWHGVNVNPV